MVKFFKWLDSKIRQSREAECTLAKCEPVPRTPDTQGTTFILYPASGGHVLEVRNYDRKNDRTNTSLHIINRDDDMGEEIGKIITYEALQR